MTRPPRLRRLSDEEILLWRAVAETVDTRLAGSTLLPAAWSPPLPPSSEPVPAAAPLRHVPPPVSPARPAPLVGLDRRARQGVIRGKIGIDRRIDLHGLTQAAAHGAVRSFLRQAHADDLRLVLVVTGKGERQLSGIGALKRLVPHWLGELDLRGIVLGFETAGASHGGSGALYVRLRRRRTAS